jgi:hypothetical protein
MLVAGMEILGRVLQIWPLNSGYFGIYCCIDRNKLEKGLGFYYLEMSHSSSQWPATNLTYSLVL